MTYKVCFWTAWPGEWGQSGLKVVGVVHGALASDPKLGELVSRSPDSGLIQHLILQPHLPPREEEGR